MRMAYISGQSLLCSSNQGRSAHCTNGGEEGGNGP